jgi:Lar family restriction alleviation protein
MEQNELKPCPFCGGDNIEILKIHGVRYGANCNDCDTLQDSNSKMGAEAIAAWNTRPSPWIKIVEGDPSTLPKDFTPVFVKGGLAMYKHGRWYTGMATPMYEREIQWKVTHWMPIPELPKGKE